MSKDRLQKKNGVAEKDLRLEEEGDMLRVLLIDFFVEEYGWRTYLAARAEEYSPEPG
jgi:hypothetical protein